MENNGLNNLPFPRVMEYEYSADRFIYLNFEGLNENVLKEFTQDRFISKPMELWLWKQTIDAVFKAEF